MRARSRCRVRAVASTGTAGSNLCICSNSCNYASHSGRFEFGANILTILNGDCMANPDPASGKSNHTCVPANI